MIADRRSPDPAQSRTLVLYDGVCALCNRLVSFLLHHDRRDCFRFAPLQSDPARALLQKHGLNSSELDTVVLLAEFGHPTERALTRSGAVLYALHELGGTWRLSVILRLLPLFLRDRLYDYIARRRYRMFGRFDQCPFPQPEHRHKFMME